MGDTQISNDLFMLDKQQKIIDGLVENHFSINPNYFSSELVTALYQELQYHRRENHLCAAHIGKEQHRIRMEQIRGDSILWLTGASAAQRAYLDEMEQLRQLLNQQLFLGLTELEAHFAHYPPGTGYQKHLDSFQNSNRRRISIVTYLNPLWKEEHGGQLLLYKDELVCTAVPPLAGTLACFVSEEIPHQVTISHSDRASIAGWFRVRALGKVLPS